MDLARLRAIVRPSAPSAAAASVPRRELTYEPDDGRGYEATLDLDRVADVLGGRLVATPFGSCLAIERRYEADRWHGDLRIGDCELAGMAPLRLLDPALRTKTSTTGGGGDREARVVFLDLETTGLSGGAGTVAFLVGCGYFDVGAFQVRQFLLTSHSAERALLAAAADLLERADLIVTYNGKTFDLPVMETRWAFHRMSAPLADVPHFDLLHPARRLWRARVGESLEGGCRLTTLERVLLNMQRLGDVDGFEIPGRFFHFLRTADAAPLEPVLEHNRLDLVSLAAVMSRAVRLAVEGDAACRNGQEALSLGRVFERAGELARAEACYRRALDSSCAATKGEALYRLALRCRRERRFDEAAVCWRDIIELAARPSAGGGTVAAGLRKLAVEALAIHHEHRRRDLSAARELALAALDGSHASQTSGIRHRLARLERKLAREAGTLFRSSAGM